MEKLYKFAWDCGRQGTVEGVFIAEESEVKKIIGKDVFLGEALGKHSDIYGTIEESEIVVLTDNQKVVNVLKKAIGLNISGYNPILYCDQAE